MTDRELMQQALDALEDVADDAEESHKTVAAIEAIRARLAQPEPEPVAKMRELLEVQGCDGNWNFDPYMQGMFNGMEMMMSLVDGRDPAFRKAPDKWLYTAPPQREWQGLTENEIKHLWYEACQTNLELTSQLIVHLARNIEAKLKEKNHD
jgi:hypothetical protein